MEWLNSFFKEFYYLFSEMAPYLLLGFLFAGLLKAYFPQKGITRYLGKPGFKSTANASLLGVPMPLCSCGVIPTGISFYRNGATKGSTTSFLISTPQTGVDSIMATYALLGLPFAVIRPIVALVTGLLGGTLSHSLEKNQFSESESVEDLMNIKENNGNSRINKFKMVFQYGFGELLEDIVKWLLIGLIAAALLSVIIPDSFFSEYIGNPYLEMLIVLAASIPMYICATGSIPMAAVLLLKGLSPGAALVLLMAGPATNVATMTVIGKVMGRKTLLIYLFSIIGGALAFGFIVNTFLPPEWFLFTGSADHVHSFLPEWITISSTGILGAIILLSVYKRYFRKENKSFISDSISKKMTITIRVEGMTCNHCKTAVENNLNQLPDIEVTNVDLTNGSITLKGDVDLVQVEKTVDALGYRFTGSEV